MKEEITAEEVKWNPVSPGCFQSIFPKNYTTVIRVDRKFQPPILSHELTYSTFMRSLDLGVLASVEEVDELVAAHHNGRMKARRIRRGDYNASDTT